MKTSEQGLDFIRGFESYLTKQPDGSCKAYTCQAGRWTCGWGCTEGVTATTHWTLDEAKERFAVEMAKHEAAVNNSIKVPITQHQFDALVSFSYNCGTGAVANLVRPLNNGDMRGTAKKFSEYCKYTDPKTKRKMVSRGLVRRRAEETAIFLKDEGGAMPQSVAAPDKTLTIKEAVAKVAAPVGAIAVAAPSLPTTSVTDTVSKTLESVHEWTGIGEQLWTLKAWALSQPLLAGSLAAGMSLFYLWSKRQETEK